MRVLVSGHHGYIGSVLAPLLADAGHEVTGLDLDLYAGCDFGSELGDIQSLRLDIRETAPTALTGFDAVVHLAALSNDPLGDLNEQWTYDVNRDGTLALALAARAAGVRRFVFASSCSMYGASGTDDALDESAPFRPLTAYAASKVEAEAGLWELADEGFVPTSMRNATVYGVSPRLRLDIVLNNLAAWAHTTGRIRLLSDGSAWRPLVHVRDVAAVARAILEAPEDLVRAEAVNVGSAPQNYRIRELAEVLAAETGCEIEIATGAETDPRSYRVDFSKLGQMFPELELAWDAERGARELIDAYRQVGLTFEQFEGRRFVRLRQLRHLLDEGLLDDELHWIESRDRTGALRPH
jgi:nucleoside-diphosphate-sugar epimerase